MSGPYVDYACANLYTFTLSVPAHASGQALGIVAMDIPFDHLEPRIMPAHPGDRLSAHPQAVTTRSRSLVRLCSLTGWMLAPLTEARP